MKSIVKSVRNLRDIGGLKTSDGRTVKNGVLLRGAGLGKLTADDSVILKEKYRLSAVLDLRTDMELKRTPDKRVEGVEYHHMPIFSEKAAGITHEEDADLKKLSPDMNALYRMMVSEECAQNYSKVMRFILERKSTDGALLFHCTEGKDRTGVTAMLVLSVLGVPFENIMQDYLLTNEVNHSKANRYYLLARLFGRDKASALSLKNAFLAKEEYLVSAMDEIKDKWGTVENYIIFGLGISKEAAERFRNDMTY